MGRYVPLDLETNKGDCELTGVCARYCLSAVTGQRGDPRIKGNGISSVRCRNWIVLVRVMRKIAPCAVKVTLEGLKWHALGSRVSASVFGTKLEIRRKEKKATKTRLAYKDVKDFGNRRGGTIATKYLQ